MDGGPDCVLVHIDKAIRFLSGVISLIVSLTRSLQTNAEPIPTIVLHGDVEVFSSFLLNMLNNVYIYVIRYTTTTYYIQIFYSV